MKNTAIKNLTLSAMFLAVLAIMVSLNRTRLVLFKRIPKPQLTEN